MILFVSTAAQSPQTALVLSRSDNTRIDAPEVVVHDNLDVTIYLVDGAGNYDAAGGQPTSTVKFAIGVIGSSPLAYQNTWTPIVGGWNAQLNLNTVPADTLLAIANPAAVVIELEITDAAGVKLTYLQIDTTLRRDLIPNSVPVPVGIDTYYTAPQSDLRFVRNLSSVTGLIGGGSTNLDGQAIINEAVGTMVAVVISGSVYFYQVIASTAATASPFYVRGSDYANPGNAKVFQLVSPLSATAFTGFTLTQSTPATTWTVTHNFGYYPAGISVLTTHAGAVKLTDCEIIHTSVNAFTVNHRQNQTGTVRCI